MVTLKPADMAVKEFGGVRKLARLIGVNPSTVSRWRKNDGLIPSKKQQDVIRAARDCGIQITVNHLINGKRYKDAS